MLLQKVYLLEDTNGRPVPKFSLRDHLNEGRQGEMVGVHCRGPHLCKIVPEVWTVHFQVLAHPQHFGTATRKEARFTYM